MGSIKGKSDKTDSCQIAKFAWLRKDELPYSVPMPIKLIELQRLMSLREQRVKQNRSLKYLEKGMLVTVANEKKDDGIRIIRPSLKQVERHLLN